MADTILPTVTALQKAVRDAVSPIPISVENVEFTPPADLIYVRCQIIPTGVEDPVFGSRYRRENYQLQLFAVNPINKGTGGVITLASQLKQTFYRGYEISIDNLRIRVLNTPSLGGNIPLDNVVVAPLTVPVTVEVYD